MTLEESRERLLRATEITPEMLGEHFRAVVATVPGNHSVEQTSPEDFIVSTDGKSDGRFNTGNVMLLLGSQEAEERRPTIANWESMIRSSLLHTEIPFERSGLLPVLRSKAWIAEVDRLLAHAGTPLVTRPFVGALVSVLSQDLPDRTANVKPEALRTAGLSAAEAFAIADANLAEKGRAVEILDVAPFRALGLDGTYEVSLMQVQGLWEELAAKHGRLAVAAPMRDAVVFAPADDRRLVEELRKLAKHFFAQGAYPLTDEIFLYENGRWSVLHERLVQ